MSFREHSVLSFLEKSLGESSTSTWNDFRRKLKLYLFRAKETDEDAGYEGQAFHAGIT